MIQICMRCYEDSHKCRCDKDLKKEDIEELIDLLAHSTLYFREYEDNLDLYFKALQYLNKLESLI